MALDLPALHRRALDATRALVAGVGPDQLHLPTPDEDWDVTQLLNHVVSGNFWAAELAAGKTIDEVGDRLDGDVLGGNVLAAYDESARQAGDVFAEPGAMERPCAVSYGPVPGEVYCGHRFIDVLIHGWDLAVGTSQTTVLDLELVDACLEVVLPQAEMLAGSGAFGSNHEIAPDANPQTRLLAILGRQG